MVDTVSQALEKYEDENTEKLSTPVKVPKSLRVRRDSWVQDEGDEVGTPLIVLFLILNHP